MRHLLRLTLLAGAAAVLASGAAAAGTVVINPFFGCPGGVREVPVDSTIVLRQGWATDNRGLAVNFLQTATATLSIDGASRADADDEAYWSLVNPAGNDWIARWTYPTGITLASGDSLSFSFDWIVGHAGHDGITLEGDHDRRPALGGPGSVFGGPLACTVVAASA